MENAIVQLGAGGVIAYGILKLVLEFLANQRAKKNGSTQFMNKPQDHGELHEMAHCVRELHDAIMASPPRPSLVSAVSELQNEMRRQVSAQHDSVKVLEQIRDVLKDQSSKLDAARCVATETEKKI